MLAHLVVRDHPRNRRKRSIPRRAVEVADRGDVAELVVGADGVEPRKRIPDSRRPGVLLLRMADDRGVVCAIRLTALEDVVAPGNAVLVQQVRQVGPWVIRRATRPVLRPPGGGVGDSTAFRQLRGSCLRLQFADHSETMNRCIGKLQEVSDSNM